MADVVEAAKARILTLEAELKTLKDFITSAEKVAAILAVPQVSAAAGSASGAAMVRGVGERALRGSNPKTGVVIPMVVEILKLNGAPMTRREIWNALAARGTVIQGADPIKALGTILWRAKDDLVYVDDKGYWPLGEALEARGQVSIFD